MALSGSFRTTAYDSRCLELSWTATQSIANNTSTISWTLKAVGTGEHKYYNAGNFKAVIDGETVYFSEDRITTSDGLVIASGTKTIAHNSDGSRAFSAYAEAGIWSYAVNCTGSATFTLNQIPRAATITSAPDFNDEQNPIITYSNQAMSSVSSLEACISLTGAKDDIAYRAIPINGTSYTFNLADEERAVLINATATSNSRTVYFYIKTVIAGVTYLKSIPKTFSIINAEPSISPTVEDVGGSSVPLTGNSDIVIKGFNYMQASSLAATYKGATIASQKISCGNSVVNAGSGAFSNVESGEFIFSVTDSRGNTTVQTVTKQTIEYIKLTCNLAAEAPTTAGEATLTITGNYFSGSFGAQSNTLAIEYRYKANNEEYGEWAAASYAIADNKYSATVELPGLNYLNSYTFQARAIDKISTIESTERKVKTTPIFDWGENDFNFNVPVTVKGDLSVEGDISAEGSATIGGDMAITGALSLLGANLADFIVEEGTADNNWNYIKFNNGLAIVYSMNFGITMPAYSALGSLYWRTIEITLPIITSSIFVSIGDSGADYARWTRCNGNWGSNKVTIQQYSVNTNGNSAYTRLQGFVIGKWK